MDTMQHDTTISVGFVEIFPCSLYHSEGQARRNFRVCLNPTGLRCDEIGMHEAKTKSVDVAFKADRCMLIIDVNRFWLIGGGLRFHLIVASEMMLNADN